MTASASSWHLFCDGDSGLPDRSRIGSAPGLFQQPLVQWEPSGLRAIAANTNTHCCCHCIQSLKSSPVKSHSVRPVVIAGEVGSCPPALGVAGWGGSAATAALSQRLAVRYESDTGGCLSVLFPADNVELPPQI